MKEPPASYRLAGRAALAHPRRQHLLRLQRLRWAQPRPVRRLTEGVTRTAAGPVGMAAEAVAATSAGEAAGGGLAAVVAVAVVVEIATVVTGGSCHRRSMRLLEGRKSEWSPGLWGISMWFCRASRWLSSAKSRRRLLFP